MNEVIKFLKNNNTRINDQMIHVYGWQKEYDLMLRPSVCKYLFEELLINENNFFSNAIFL